MSKINNPINYFTVATMAPEGVTGEASFYFYRDWALINGDASLDFNVEYALVDSLDAQPTNWTMYEFSDGTDGWPITLSNEPSATNKYCMLRATTAGNNTFTTWYGSGENWYQAGYQFKRAGSGLVALAVGGDITTLLRQDGNVLDLTFGGSDADSTFNRFFAGLYNEVVFGINENKCLLLPSTTLTDFCYSEMFIDQYFTKNFTGSGVDFSAASSIPYCGFNSTFENSLADIKFNSTTLEFDGVQESGCRRMFNGYKNILDISLVKFRKLRTEAAYAMFSGVEFEDYLPSVQVSAIADQGSMAYMFYGCEANDFDTNSYIQVGSFGSWACREMYTRCSAITTPILPKIVTTSTDLEVKETTIELDKRADAVGYNFYLDSVGLGKFIGQGITVPIPLNKFYPGTGYIPNSFAEERAQCSKNPKYNEDTRKVNGTPLLLGNVFCSMYDSCAGITDISDLDFTYYDNYLNGTAETSDQAGLFQYMFANCTNLETIPKKLSNSTWLPASFYKRMFSNCQNLNTLSAVPATELGANCYKEMYYGCSKIKMSEVQDANYPYEFTFGTVPGDANSNSMFVGTGGTFTGTPIVQTYYTANGAAESKFRGLTLSWNLNNEANSRIDIQLRGVGIRTLPGKVEYSYDAETWNELDLTYTDVKVTEPGTIITLDISRPVIYLRGYNTTYAYSNNRYCHFVTDSYPGSEESTVLPVFDVTGDITSLLNGEGGVEDLSTYGEFTFYGLFAYNTDLSSIVKYENITNQYIAPRLLFPSLKLSNYCYSNMFKDCKKLEFYWNDKESEVSDPKFNGNLLPATTLAKGCYESMFNGAGYVDDGWCSIDYWGFLDAPVLATNCYCKMFANSSMYYTLYMAVDHDTWEPKLKIPAGGIIGSCCNRMYANSSVHYAKVIIENKNTKSYALARMYEGCRELDNAYLYFKEEAWPSNKSVLYRFMYDVNGGGNCNIYSPNEKVIVEIGEYGIPASWTWSYVDWVTFVDKIKNSKKVQKRK